MVSPNYANAQSQQPEQIALFEDVSDTPVVRYEQMELPWSPSNLYRIHKLKTRPWRPEDDKRKYRVIMLDRRIQEVAEETGRTKTEVFRHALGLDAHYLGDRFPENFDDRFTPMSPYERQILTKMNWL